MIDMLMLFTFDDVYYNLFIVNLYIKLSLNTNMIKIK